MIEGLKPTAPITGSAYDLPFALPMTLADALALLRGSKPLVEMFGERFVAAYCAVKENEVRDLLAGDQLVGTRTPAAERLTPRGSP